MPRAAQAVHALAEPTRPRLLRALGRAALRWGPLSLHFEAPVAQVYWLRRDLDAFLCLNDFFGAVVPGATDGARARVDLYDGTGRLRVRRDVRLADRGSACLPVRDLLGLGPDDEAVGLATVRLAPRAQDQGPLRAAGLLSSHFFTYFAARDGRSCGMVHPQTALTAQPGTKRFVSNQDVATDGLSALTLLQANPSPRPFTARYSLHDATGAAVARQELRLPARSGAHATFPVPPAARGPLHVEVERLPVPNGKPLLMRAFADGRWSLSHA